jgi:hypothetical protein
MQKGSCSSLPTTNVTANEINLTEGLSGTLVDRIVIHRNREALNGEDALDRMRKRKAMANEQILFKNKQMTAGLLASSGHFCLSNEVCQYVQEKANTEKNYQIRAQLKKKNEYDEPKILVDAIKANNLPPEKWTSKQLNTMLKWYKQDGDPALPKCKPEQLELYHKICDHEDLPPPSLPDELMCLPNEDEDMPPLPLPQPEEDLLIPLETEGLTVAPVEPCVPVEVPPPSEDV